MRTALLLLLAILPLSAQTAPPAQKPAPSPAPKKEAPAELTEYMGRTIAKTMHWTGAEWLLRRTREQEENSTLMLEQLKIQPGWTICDLGCGNGYYSLKMAEKTGEKGTILAEDIQPQMLDMLKARTEGRGLANIKTVLGELWDPKLPPASCDLILLVDVYHEFGNPAEMLKAIHDSLKPDGVVALVEFRSEDSKVPIKPEHKMSRAQIYKEWQPAGFTIAREFHGLPWQHLIFLRQSKPGEKPVEPPPAPAAEKREPEKETDEEKKKDS